MVRALGHASDTARSPSRTAGHRTSYLHTCRVGAVTLARLCRCRGGLARPCRVEGALPAGLTDPLSGPPVRGSSSGSTRQVGFGSRLVGSSTDRAVSGLSLPLSVRVRSRAAVGLPASWEV
jgi:hypothetical protein